MEKKYELLTDDKIEHNGKILYRIRALRDFGGVEKGQFGGYVECEGNLSHKGTCWIHHEAKVYGNASIYDKAEIFDYAEVYDNAIVCGDVVVYNSAKVYGTAEVCGSVKVLHAAEIYDHAEVYGVATVREYAKICGNARVYGLAVIDDYAVIKGNSKVFDASLVYGNSIIDGRAKVIGGSFVRDGYVNSINGVVCFSNVGTENGTLTVYKNKDGGLLVVRGCFFGTVDEFLNKSETVHNEKIKREYELLIEVAKSRLSEDK